MEQFPSGWGAGLSIQVFQIKIHWVGPRLLSLLSFRTWSDKFQDIQ